MTKAKRRPNAKLAALKKKHAQVMAEAKKLGLRCDGMWNKEFKLSEQIYRIEQGLK